MFNDDEGGRTVMNKQEIVLAVAMKQEIPIQKLPYFLKGIEEDNEEWWEQLRKRYCTDELERTKERYRKQQIQWVSIMDAQYPVLLKEIYAPPLVLFYKGDIHLASQVCVAIVGARRHSYYGEACIKKFLPPLVEENMVTVSGLAYGIDTCVHKETLQQGGKTVAVIGAGINVYYPKENRSLQEDIGRLGCVISEYPLDAPPLKHHFPYRNRIIAGISQGVLVVEAQKKSGSLITANLALQENRKVYAVPGSLFSPYSVGTNELIQAGATPILCEKEFVRDLKEGGV